MAGNPLVACPGRTGGFAAAGGVSVGAFAPPAGPSAPVPGATVGDADAPAAFASLRL